MLLHDGVVLLSSLLSTAQTSWGPAQGHYRCLAVTVCQTGPLLGISASGLRGKRAAVHCWRGGVSEHAKKTA